MIIFTLLRNTNVLKNVITTSQLTALLLFQLLKKVMSLLLDNAGTFFKQKKAFFFLNFQQKKCFCFFVFSEVYFLFFFFFPCLFSFFPSFRLFFFDSFFFLFILSSPFFFRPLSKTVTFNVIKVESSDSALQKSRFRMF